MTHRTRRTHRPYLTPDALRGVAEWLDAKAEAIPDRAISLVDLAEWLRAEADTRTRRAAMPSAPAEPRRAEPCRVQTYRPEVIA